MDNLTHTLVGLAAAKAGLGRVSPYATAVCVAAANLPDADIVVAGRGATVYLEHHRGITHSIVGTLALGLLLPLVFVAGERVVARVRGREPRARLRGLLVASLLLTASHPLLDWTNSYGLRPFLPWSREWFYGDLVFVIDPWLWLLLGGTCFLLTSATRWRLALWSLLGAAVAAAVLFAPQQRGFEVPVAAKALWGAGLASVALARWRGVGTRGRGPALAAAALVLLVVYWGGLAVVQARALRAADAFGRHVAAEEGSRLTKVAAMPTLLNPFKWVCVAETERATYRYELGPGTAYFEDVRVLSEHERPQGEAAEAVERAARDERARVLLDFARFPVAQVWPAAEGGSVVRITDVRFGEPAPPGVRGGGTFTVEVAVPGR